MVVPHRSRQRSRSSSLFAQLAYASMRILKTTTTQWTCQSTAHAHHSLLLPSMTRQYKERQQGNLHKKLVNKWKHAAAHTWVCALGALSCFIIGHGRTLNSTMLVAGCSGKNSSLSRGEGDYHWTRRHALVVTSCLSGVMKTMARQ